jgi:hypothetical protein
MPHRKSQTSPLPTAAGAFASIIGLIIALKIAPAQRTSSGLDGWMGQLNAVFGSLYLDEITRGRLADYASDRMKAGTKGATVRRDLATLSCLCSCA